MTPQELPTSALPVSGDGKPTQINEHKRAEEARANDHEPHAMADQRGARVETSHPE